MLKQLISQLAMFNETFLRFVRAYEKANELPHHDDYEPVLDAGIYYPTADDMASAEVRQDINKRPPSNPFADWERLSNTRTELGGEGYGYEEG